MPEGRAGRSNEGRDLAAQLVMREQLKRLDRADRSP